VREFIVGPDVPARRHLWIVAVGEKHRRDSAWLEERLDNRLRAMNADYATFRGQGRIGKPLVVTVDEGAIYRWSKEVRGKLGGQSKIPHIDPTLDGEMIQSLLRFIGPRETTAGLRKVI
jgi:GH3 auxin-responsive promoter